MKRLMDLSNRVVQQTQLAIVSEEKPKDRAGLLAHFITIATCLAEIKNFQGAVSVLFALKSTPVERLKATWKLLSKKTTDQWE